MAGSSNIAWTDASWNPVRGCTRVSPGCVNCYAEDLAARYAGPGKPFEGFARKVGGDSRWTGRVELQPHMLDWPLRWRGHKAALAEGRPSRIFVNSMSDLFHEALAFGEIAAVFGVMAACPQHVFQVLTKRPARAVEFFAAMEARPGMVPHASVRAAALALARMFPPVEQPAPVMGAIHRLAAHDAEPPPWPLPNVWLGVSVENQAAAEDRIPELQRCPAAVRFVSYEPALGPVDFSRVPRACFDRERSIRHLMGRASLNRDQAESMVARRSDLDWIIAGGESGPDRRPCEVEWFADVAGQAEAAGVTFFMKQDGHLRPGQQGRIPEALWSRREFPR